MLRRSRLGTSLSSDKLTLYPNLLPIVRVAYTDVLKLLWQIVFPHFFLLVVVAQDLKKHLTIVFLVTQNWVGIVFKGHELVLIELFVLDVVENYDVLIGQVL